jgi:hypothetical protein
MRTVLCRTCLCFITTDRRHALGALRDHAIDERHDITELRCVDVDTEFWRLLTEAFGAKARR